MDAINGKKPRILSLSLSGSPTVLKTNPKDFKAYINYVNQNYPNIRFLYVNDMDATGDKHEFVIMGTKEICEKTLQAIKLKKQQGMTQEYHKQMGKLYRYSDEEVAEFNKNEPTELPKTTKPSLSYAYIA